MPRKLDETLNLINLYLHHCGESEIPEDFHLWCCLSMIAALVGDRVWYEKFIGRKLTPNLYVALVGPSGIGKGEAIDTSMKFIKDNPRVNMYAGSITAQALVRRMGSVSQSANGSRVSSGKLYLVSPELAQSLGRGERADAFIQHMTELYTGRDYPMRGDTISRGEVTMREYCINWIFGSNMTWLTKSIPKEMMLGGFIGRVAIISAAYDLDKRIEDPRYPEDYDEVTDYLYQRIEELAHIEGPFKLDEDARAIRTHWYNTREKPTDENLISSWKREDDFVLKMAMGLSLADSLELRIRKHHMIAAQKLTARALKAVSALVTASAETLETSGLEQTRAFVKMMGIAPHQMLIRFASKNGMNAERIRHHVDQLVQEGVVTRLVTQRGQMYEWKGRRR